ncbi:hypothetical protein ABGB07_33680 [Micromonosporaceae bacterium B7E4]
MNLLGGHSGGDRGDRGGAEQISTAVFGHLAGAPVLVVAAPLRRGRRPLFEVADNARSVGGARKSC